MKKGIFINDIWKTPSHIYEKLNEEFNFDHDPCPLSYDEISIENDGLIKEWGKRNFVNPPYSRGNKEAFIIKAIEEMHNGKLSVILIPVSTSTKLFHNFIFPNASEIRFVEKRIRFEGFNSDGKLVNNKCGMHDTMIVVFDPLYNESKPSISRFIQE